MATTLMYTAILPDFQKQGEKFQELAKAYPPELMKAFGVENAALIFSSLEAFLSNLKKYLSFFHYFDANDALVNNHVDPQNYLVFMGAIWVFTLLGAIIFQKRDVVV